MSAAIVGMACIFPGAPDLEAYEANLRAGVDAISEAPAARLDPAFFAEGRADRFATRRGGFVDGLARFDAARFGVMPVQAQGGEPDQLLALQVASDALADAGLEGRAFARERTAVIVGRGGYAGPGRTRLEDAVRGAEQLVRALRALVPGVAEAELERVRAEHVVSLAPAGPDAAIGLVPNLAASRIANRLDLHGPAYTVDAACASSLLAVDQAMLELGAGRADLVLAGGVHLCQDEAFWSVFTRLGALSPSGRIRPFDRRADGLLAGEGVGFVVLKREADARRDGDRIWAVIRGAGVSSDGRGSSPMAPRPEGQLLALERAWAAAGVPAATVGLVEAHGTGTSAGDAAELETLRRFFGPVEPGAPRTPLGSVKSMIGHAMPAAGMAGLIKAALAVHHGFVPPSLGCEEPRPELEATRFRVPAAAEPWERTAATPRRAAVSAFGFGGINAHVVVDEPDVAAPRRKARSAEPEERVLRLAAASPEALLASLARGEEGGAGPSRLAVVDPTPERLARARAVIEKGKPWRGREGIWFAPEGLLARGGKLCFLFPGVDSTFEPRVDDVAASLGVPAPRLPAAGAGLEELGVAIVAVNRLLHRALLGLGVKPDLVAGHSIGEWSGLVATGAIPEEALDGFVATIRPGSLRVPGAIFAAAGCGVEQARDAAEGLDGVSVSHDNCPHQVILCGPEAGVAAALGRLRAGGVLCQALPFQSGFHSSLFEPYLPPHRENFERLPLRAPSVPLWSATTCAPYPGEAAAIRALSLEHLVRPVRFRELVEALWADGARAFVQVGTGSLVGFVEDTLRGRPHLAWSANVPQRSGLAQLRRLAAALYVEGADVAPPGPVARSSRPLPLALGVPLFAPSRPLSIAAAAPPAAVPSPLAAEALATFEEAARATRDVLAALDARAPAAGPRDETRTRLVSVETFPAVLDHCFFRQPPGWPSIADRHPVVPMTTLVAWMIEAAEALVPGRVAVGLEDVSASRWLAVARPVPLPVRARTDGGGRVEVTLGDYARGTVLLGDRYPEAPPARVAPLPGERPVPVSAAALYEERWMFHGPAFQAVRSLDGMSDAGIRGTLRAGPAEGALLDNAGQLFGLWVMLAATEDRMAMPVRLGKVRLFGPHPPPGADVACTVELRTFAAREVIADLTLDCGGKRFCAIEGWEDRRFETDARLWPVMMFPEKHLLAEPRGALVVLRDRYRAAPTRDQLARRFLREAERAAWEAQPPRRQRAWLSERIAGKDAVRAKLLAGGRDAVFPAEVELAGDGAVLDVPTRPGAKVAVASGEELAAALLADGGAPGVAVARLGAAARGLAEATLDETELRLLGTDDREEWVARLVAAKDAAARARGGEGALRLRAKDRSGERVLVDDLWVETARDGIHVLAWTIG